MSVACVHTMFRVQKERGEPALLVPSAPEHSNDWSVLMPPEPNSTIISRDQALSVAA